MRLIILDEARDEIRELVAWYDDRDRRVATRLADLFEKAIHDIVVNPRQFSLVEMRRNPGDVRRVRLKGFPVHIVYQVVDEESYVVAVAHTSRRPGYWRKRLRP